MRPTTIRLAAAAVIILLLGPAPSLAQDIKPIQLPAAKTEGGKPLMDALKTRQSARTFAPTRCPRRCCRTCCGPRSGLTGRTDTGRRHPRATGRRLTSTW